MLVTLSLAGFKNPNYHVSPVSEPAGLQTPSKVSRPNLSKQSAAMTFVVAMT
jgi:hypothetical protein